ncbi:MAG TPA: HPF/RaiA family ribosome-associated protein [Gemmataceae bacterium]
MRYSDKAYNLRVEIDTHECELTEAEVNRMLAHLDDKLRKHVEHFPVADLRIVVEHNRRDQEYVVKTALILTGRTLVNHEHAPEVYSAFERCLESLVENIAEYKQNLGDVPERKKHQKGTQQEVEPSLDPDPARLEGAVKAGDYAAFREATFGYEESVRKRAGRWVERYPDIAAQIGSRIKLEELVEGVFLRAFENYAHWPKELRFGDWLEALIDPTVKALQRNPDEELENIRLVRSAREAEQGPGAV